jgi:hypothetical protein
VREAILTRQDRVSETAFPGHMNAAMASFTEEIK